MDVKEILLRLLARQSLDVASSHDLFVALMSGGLTVAQIAAILVALAAKGETIDEIEGAARALREHCVRLPIDGVEVVDIVGTGGDAKYTFNVSTAAALIASAAGAVVAKHGNRAQSGLVGAADVLETLGVRIDLSPEQVAGCVTEIGLGFLFAPTFHPAMKYAAPVRREIGVRTILNLLGPLASPAAAKRQVVGVFSDHWVEPFAEVLRRLGSKHALVVHGRDGIDEISLSAPTLVVELRDDRLQRYELRPADLGFEPRSLDCIQMADRASAAIAMRDVLAGQPGPCLDISLINAGATLYVAGCAKSIRDGVELARTAVLEGGGRRQLARLIEVSNA